MWLPIQIRWTVQVRLQKSFNIVPELSGVCHHCTCRAIPRYQSSTQGNFLGRSSCCRSWWGFMGDPKTVPCCRNRMGHPTISPCPWLRVGCWAPHCWEGRWRILCARLTSVHLMMSPLPSDRTCGWLWVQTVDSYLQIITCLTLAP